MPERYKPSLKGFIAKTKGVYFIELHIARKRDKFTYHLKKCKKLISVAAGVVTNWSISNCINMYYCEFVLGFCF